MRLLPGRNDVLISWKRYWNQAADAVSFGIKHYRELVSELQSGGEILGAQGLGGENQEKFSALLDRLAAVTSDQELTEAHESIIAMVRDGIQKVGQHIRSRDQAVKEIVTLLGDEVAKIASDNQQHESQLSDFTTALQQVGQSADLREMRRKLQEEVNQIRSYVDRVREANRVTVRHLEEQLQTVTKRLEQTERVAYCDALTGLPNRRAGEESLRRTVAQGSRFSVLLLDLNGFKRINDQWGHGCGDQVLEVVGKRLAGVAENALLACRWGGDEFLVLSGGDLACAQELRRTIQSAITGAYTIVAIGRTFEVNVGICIGVAEHQKGEKGPELVSRADADLYAQKHHLALRR